MSEPSAVSPAAVQAAREILELPLNRSFGLELQHHEPGAAVATFESATNTLGPRRALHVGVVHALMESVCLIAVLPLLEPGEHAVTHDFHASVMRPIPEDLQVELRAQVQRRGKTLALVDGEAWADGKLCYMARVTKTVIGDAQD